MADGDKVPNDRVSCVYVDDFGNSHTRAVKTFYQTQAALGWDLNSNHSLKPCPRGLKPRTWLVCDPDHPNRRSRVIVATNADYIAGVMDTTTVKVNWYGQEYTMTLYGKEGERVRGLVRDVETQYINLST